MDYNLEATDHLVEERTDSLSGRDSSAFGSLSPTLFGSPMRNTPSTAGRASVYISSMFTIFVSLAFFLLRIFRDIRFV